MKHFYHLPDLDYKKILLLRTDKLGDALATTPAIRALFRTYPHAQFDFLGSHLNHAVLQYAPEIRHSYVYDKKKWPSILPLIVRLRKNRYDALLNFTSGSKSASFLCSCLNAPIKIACGNAHAHYTKTYTHILTSNKTEKHYTIALCNFLEDMGIFTQDYRFYFPVSQKHIEEAKEKYPKRKPYRFCLFLGNIKAQRYHWATENYAKLAQYIVEKYPDIELYFMAGKGEEMLLQRIHLEKSAYNIVYGYNLHESGAFFLSCDLVIATSTGAAHLASAMGCTLCSIITQYQVEIWRPLGQNDFYICPDTPVSDIHSVRPEEVFARVEAYIQSVLPGQVLSTQKLYPGLA